MATPLAQATRSNGRCAQGLIGTRIKRAIPASGDCGAKRAGSHSSEAVQGARRSWPGRRGDEPSPTFKQRDKVKWDGLTLTTAAFAALTLVWIWYGIWDLRHFSGLAGFWFYLSLLLEMFLLFLAAATCLPDDDEFGAEFGWSLAAYHQRQRRYLWTLFALFHLSFALRWGYFVWLKPRPMTLDVEIYAALAIAPIAICVALIFARRRAVQWGLLGLLIVAKAISVWSATL